MKVFFVGLSKCPYANRACDIRLHSFAELFTLCGTDVTILNRYSPLVNSPDKHKSANYEIKELEGIENLDSKWRISCDKNDKRILTNDLELHIIEIPKAEKILEKDKYNRIAQWLMFLDNPNTERVEEIMKENEEVKKANSILYEMSEDEELERLAELREKWDLDERSARQNAIDEGLEEGIKKGRKEGIREGEENKSTSVSGGSISSYANILKNRNGK